MASDSGSDVMLKPIYIKNTDIQLDPSNRVTDFELLKVVTESVGNKVKCIQLDRNLWRVYLSDNPSKEKILAEGLELRNQNISVYETNPFSSGASSPDDEVLRVTIKGVPLSVDDSSVVNMLERFGVKRKSGIKFEKIRDPQTRKMTDVLNGNRFVYIEPLAVGKHLPRNSYCAGLQCQIFHFGQPTKKRPVICSNCWQDDHLKHQCQNSSACRICKSTDHLIGSSECPHYVETQDKIETFRGKTNVLSNFYECQLDVFGVKQKSSEHAFQYAKYMRSEDVIAANKVLESKTAFEAKSIGDRVTPSDDWDLNKVNVMSDIIDKKVEQVSEFREKLYSLKKNTVIVEATSDPFWASGISEEDTKHINKTHWPGKNMLGTIIMKHAEQLKKKKRDDSNQRKTSVRNK